MLNNLMQRLMKAPKLNQYDVIRCIWHITIFQKDFYAYKMFNHCPLPTNYAHSYALVLNFKGVECIGYQKHAQYHIASCLVIEVTLSLPFLLMATCFLPLSKENVSKFNKKKGSHLTIYTYIWLQQQLLRTIKQNNPLKYNSLQKKLMKESTIIM